jgi:hypothetical protein
MKMAALTAASAVPVRVAPAPPQIALSMICPPCECLAAKLVVKAYDLPGCIR